MADKSAIEWTDATWTPIRARVKSNAPIIAAEKGYTSLVQIAVEMAGRVGPHCEHVSPGCEHCYSDTNNSRCLPHNGTGLPFDRRSRDLVDIFVDEKILLQPLKWRKPKKVFVCSQTDLFGEWVPDEAIDRVFAVMALCPQHTFQVLTKRAERMRKYFAASHSMEARRRVQDVLDGHTGDDAVPYSPEMGTELFDCWPLPHVWLGVSVENQEQADKRIPLLLQTPAAIRWVSAEPLLAPVALSPRGIDWVVAGGESGPDARPMHPDWARNLRDQCKSAKVPFLFKQWGAYEPQRQSSGSTGFGSHVHHWETPYDAGDCRVSFKVGKHKAGRHLDGVLHDEYPG